MTKRQSRGEWEQELWERQCNVTPAEELRNNVHLAAGLRGGPPSIPDRAHLFRFVTGIAVATLAATSLASGFLLAAVAGIVLGGLLTASGIRWRPAQTRRTGKHERGR